FAKQMQELNDRFARLEASGASASELGILARASIEAISGGHYNLSDDEGDSGRDELGQLFNAQRLRSPQYIAKQLSARKDWGEGNRQRLETWFNHGFLEMDKTLAEHGIRPKRDAQRRAKAFDDVLAERPIIEKMIQRLPPEAQREAWAYYHQQLRSFLKAAEERPKLTRNYAYDGRESRGPNAAVPQAAISAIRALSQSFAPSRTEPSVDVVRAAEGASPLSELMAEGVRAQIQTSLADARSGISRQLHQSGLSIIRNLA
ncbi:MAG: hypothetical protein AAFV29_23640, partial [Myxococcota bacterium]